MEACKIKDDKIIGIKEDVFISQLYLVLNLWFRNQFPLKKLEFYPGGFGLCLDYSPVLNQSLISIYLTLGRAVAQSGSALRWGCRGREFKSRRPDQFFILCLIRG